jgi:BolA protein
MRSGTRRRAVSVAAIERLRPSGKYESRGRDAQSCFRRSIVLVAAVIMEADMGAYRERMTAKLTAAFAPTGLEIVDDSHRHAGHAGDNPDGGGETHFKVSLTSAAFAGQSRVARHRMVHDVLAPELRERIHALELKLKSPGEA